MCPALPCIIDSSCDCHTRSTDHVIGVDVSSGLYICFVGCLLGAQSWRCCAATTTAYPGTAPLPVSLRTLIILVCNPPEDVSSTGSLLAQLCIAVRGLPALERFFLHAYCSEMLPQLAPLLKALQHCPLLTHLDLSSCGLKGLSEG